MKVMISVSQLCFFALFGLSIFDLGARWMAVLMILCGIFLFFSERRSWRPIPSVSMVIVAYLAGYAIPVLMYPQELGGLIEGAMDRMMQWSLMGFLVFSMAYSIAAKKGGKEKPVDAVHQGRNISYASFAYLALGTIALLAWLTNAIVYGVGLTFVEGQAFDSGNETVRQILGLLANMKYAYLLGYLLLRRSGRTTRLHFWLMLATIAISVFEIMLIGAKAAIIKLMVVAILSIALGNTGRLKWSNVLAGSLAIVLALMSFSIITEYRYIVRSAVSSGQEATDVGLRVDAFMQAILGAVSDRGPQRETDVDRSDIAARFGSGAFGLGWLLEFTNGVSPYENAVSSILTPLYAFVPRALWQDKPIFFNSGRFASDYFGWKYGGISISLLGSLYFAWGYPGILIGMAVAGFGLARIISRIEQKGFIAVNSVTCLTILMLHLLDVGAEFQPLVVNITRALILLAVIRLAWRVHLGRQSMYYNRITTKQVR